MRKLTLATILILVFAAALFAGEGGEFQFPEWLGYLLFVIATAIGFVMKSAVARANLEKIQSISAKAGKIFAELAQTLEVFAKADPSTVTGLREVLDEIEDDINLIKSLRNEETDEGLDRLEKHTAKLKGLRSA